MSMKSLRIPVVSLTAGILLSGCSMRNTAAIDACIVWQPVSWSQKDTPRTIEEVKINNARWEGWCKGRR